MHIYTTRVTETVKGWGLVTMMVMAPDSGWAKATGLETAKDWGWVRETGMGSVTVTDSETVTARGWVRLPPR